jgi:hypothetical protein
LFVGKEKITWGSESNNETQVRPLKVMERKQPYKRKQI